MIQEVEVQAQHKTGQVQAHDPGSGSTSPAPEIHSDLGLSTFFLARLKIS
jgi:hypothetical protein